MILNMKTIFSLCLAGFLLISCGTPSQKEAVTQNSTNDPVDPSTYASTITSDELKEMLYTYASDEFEGRETGEKGQKMAVEYLKEQYMTMGIPSPLGGDDYFQEVPLEKQQVAEAILSVNGTAFNSFEDQIVTVVSKSMSVSNEDIVYVGFGIDAENYSDYKDLNVKGKFVIAKNGEPKDAAGNYITSGTSEDTKWTNGRQALSSKRDAAVANGAKGLLLMDNNLFSRYAPWYQRQAASGTSGRLSLKSNEEGLVMLLISENLGTTIYPEYFIR